MLKSLVAHATADTATAALKSISADLFQPTTGGPLDIEAIEPNDTGDTGDTGDAQVFVTLESKYRVTSAGKASLISVAYAHSLRE